MSGAPLREDGTPVACALCGLSDTRTLYVKQGYAIGRCRGCGLVYASPRAPQAHILARYSREYFWDEYLPSLGVVDGRFELERFDVRYGAILHWLASRTSGRRLIEIGSGAGFFLKAAERAGWHVTGIELSEEGTRFAAERLGLDVRRVRAEELPLTPGSADAAAMFDVIEHLFEPRRVLEATARMLKPGGTVAISTPNYDAVSRYVLGVDWAVLSPLEHLYYFTEATLRQLLEAAGFGRVEYVRSHPMWGPQETINYQYTHAPQHWRARLAGMAVRRGGMPVARAVQRLGRQDALLCFATRL